MGLAMSLKSIIAAQKTGIRAGEWKGGTIPRAQWPSRKAKSKAYKYGPLYKWRIISFYANGHECRLRVLFNKDAEIFRASLGVVENGDTKVLCEYEYHASEPGWHCHARCGDLADISSATIRYGSKRVPDAGGKHRRTEFKFGKAEMDDDTAFSCAVSFFRVFEEGGLL
jgi:hypothetical protein